MNFERITFPMHTINVEIKCILSDLEIALNNPQISFELRSIFSQSDKSTLVIYFVCSEQIGVQLTVNWFGTTPIANGPDWVLLIGMRMCMASLPSPQVHGKPACSPKYTESGFAHPA